MYLAHNITASQGGHILGIFEEFEDAKKCLKDTQGFSEFNTDWGHFIRMYNLGDVMLYGIIDLPRSDK